MPELQQGHCWWTYETACEIANERTKQWGVYFTVTKGKPYFSKGPSYRCWGVTNKFDPTIKNLGE